MIIGKNDHCYNSDLKMIFMVISKKGEKWNEGKGELFK